MTQDDALLDKYNLQSVVEFIKDKFADLGKTYQQSDISQIRVLLGSRFPSGLAWSYPGYSNHEISPLYQYVCQFENAYIPFGDPGGILRQAQYYFPQITCSSKTSLNSELVELW